MEGCLQAKAPRSKPQAAEGFCKATHMALPSTSGNTRNLTAALSSTKNCDQSNQRQPAARPSYDESDGTIVDLPECHSDMREGIKMIPPECSWD